MDVRLIENTDLLEKENSEENTEFINLDNNKIKKDIIRKKSQLKLLILMHLYLLKLSPFIFC